MFYFDNMCLRRIESEIRSRTQFKSVNVIPNLVTPNENVFIEEWNNSN